MIFVFFAASLITRAVAAAARRLFRYIDARRHADMPMPCCRRCASRLPMPRALCLMMPAPLLTRLLLDAPLRAMMPLICYAATCPPISSSYVTTPLPLRRYLLMRYAPIR